MEGQPFLAAVLETCGRPLAQYELQVPGLCHGQVLIDLRYSGVCRSQLMEVRGLRGIDPWLPHLLGHEGVGTVIAIGEGVRKVVPGQDVIVGWIKSSGLASSNPIFMRGSTRINAGSATTFSELTVVSENRVYAKPQGVSDKASVLFGCALLTGAGMVLNELRPKETDKVIVVGLGGVGLAALIGTLAVRPEMVLAVDVSAEKRALAQELGADFVLDPLNSDFHEQLSDLTSGGADICFECAGSASTIEMGFQCLRPDGGILLFASHPPSGEVIKLDPFELIQGKQIRGSRGGGSNPDIDIPRIAAAAQGQGINLEVMLGLEYQLKDVDQALEALEFGRTLRPLLSLGKDFFSGTT